MKQLTQSGTRKPSAFTLIELLVVMAIIGVLAALTFPTVKSVKENATRKKVKTEMHRIETAIESYKAKHGFYPPDNPNNNPNNYSTGYRTNQLYFELSGSILLPPPPQVADRFQSLDGSAEVLISAVNSIFGVTGFMNCTKGTGDDSSQPAGNFLKGLRPGQYGGVSATTPEIRLLACSVAWPISHQFQPVPDNPGLNPWRYNSSSPTNNSSSYDLWLDIFLGGKTNRISNWSEQPQFVN